MNIKTNSFCAISRNSDWQLWLREVAADLLADLKKTIDSQAGCKANSKKMVEVYNQLYARGHGTKFEDFISRRFPYIIEGHTRTQHLPKESPPAVSTPTQPFKKAVTQYTPADFESLNKHKVFRSYRPDILSFPQKHIILDKPDRLMGLVQEFVRDKIGIDYIIEDDRAYIEYFENKHADVVSKIPRETRDVFIYRQKKLIKNGLPQSDSNKPTT